MKYIKTILILLITVILATGCSQGENNPVEPSNDKYYELSAETAHNRFLWGIWDIRINLDANTVSIESKRSVQGHWNVTGMVTPPACDDCVGINVISFDTIDRILDVDVTLKNPSAINAYDVRGILYTNDYGHLLTNADDWTGLWDIPGGQDINPFKAFAKAVTNRLFAGDTAHTEKYLVRIPKPPMWAYISYAVDVSWPGNCKEPYAITNFQQDPLYDIESSNAEIQVDVHDWQDDVNKVSISIPEIPGYDELDMTHQTGDTWSIEITNSTSQTNGEYDVVIIAESQNSGETALYDIWQLEISEVPKHSWTRTWGGDDPYGDMVQCYGVAIDDAGGVYINGQFEGDIDFDPGPDTDFHKSNGDKDAFLCKYNPDGDFQWVAAWGSTGEEIASRVAAYGNDEIYIIGVFEWTVDFDPGDGVDEHASAGLDDVFLVKFNSAGELVWTKTWGGIERDGGSSVAVDKYGYIYVCGSFDETVDFDPGPGVEEHTCLGNADVFLSKFDPNGDFQWVRTWGDNGGETAIGLAVDDSVNIYVTGWFFNVVDFDPGPGSDEHAAVDWSDAYITKFNGAGDHQWARTMGGEERELGAYIAIDDTGCPYLLGKFQFTIDLDPGAGIDERTSNGGYDIFFCKFSSGGDIQWAYTWGGWEDDYYGGVVLDSSGNIYVPGKFKSLVDFDPTDGEFKLSTFGDLDCYLSKFDLGGEYHWTLTWGGSGGETAGGIAIDELDCLYIAGWFSSSTADFDPGPGIDEHSKTGYWDAFLSKFLPPDDG